MKPYSKQTLPELEKSLGSIDRAIEERCRQEFAEKRVIEEFIRQKQAELNPTSAYAHMKWPQEAVPAVLRDHGHSMTLKEIVSALELGGYKSASANIEQSVRDHLNNFELKPDTKKADIPSKTYMRDGKKFGFLEWDSKTNKK